MSECLMTVNCHVDSAGRSHKPQWLLLLSQVLGGASADAAGCGCSLHVVLALQCCMGPGWLPVSRRVKVTFLTGCTVSPLVLVVGMVVVISSVFVQHRAAVLLALTRANVVTRSAPRCCCAGVSLGMQDTAACSAQPLLVPWHEFSRSLPYTRPQRILSPGPGEGLSAPLPPPAASWARGGQPMQVLPRHRGISRRAGSARLCLCRSSSHPGLSPGPPCCIQAGPPGCPEPGAG